LPRAFNGEIIRSKGFIIKYFCNFCNTKLILKMKKVLLNLALIASIVVSSCDVTGERIDGNGNVTTITREVNNAEKIKVSGALDVFVNAGAPSVRIEADENIIQYVETITNDNWLEIKTRDNINIHTSNTIKVYVTTPSITDINVNGSGNIVCNGKFSGNEDMKFNVTGSGDIRIDVNAPKVEADITGSGNLHVSGETRNLDVDVTGSGNYDGPGLKAENAVAKISGSGDISLFADNNLKAHINGSGNVKYRGNPTVDSHIAGSGAVVKEQ
jgi:hypothetical protein